jgi:hypothetical protein
MVGFREIEEAVQRYGPVRMQRGTNVGNLYSRLVSLCDGPLIIHAYGTTLEGAIFNFGRLYEDHAEKQTGTFTNSPVHRAEVASSWPDRYVCEGGVITVSRIDDQRNRKYANEPLTRLLIGNEKIDALTTIEAYQKLLRRTTTPSIVQPGSIVTASLARIHG